MSTVDDVVLVDALGSAIGTSPRLTVHHSRTPRHLAFSFYGFDAQGRFLVTTRAATKRTWPGIVTNTCCGHPRPGERLEDAVRRRVREELGVQVQRSWLALPLFSYHAAMPDGTVEHELCPVFVGSLAGELHPDPDEVGSAEWSDWADFYARVEREPTRCSPWAVLQVPLLDASGFIELARRPKEALGGAA
jgi:isopentenyl-diphosphate delta-isomerase type 1